MNGKPNLSVGQLLAALLRRLGVGHQRTLLIFIVVALLYLFSVVVFMSFKNAPRPNIDSRRYSQLYLIEYINGFRDYQQDFDVENVFFGKTFLTFTLNIKFKTKSSLVIKKVAVDIILGLVKEYPELDTITIDVIRDVPPETVASYGRATYDRREEKVVWRYE